VNIVDNLGSQYLSNPGSDLALSLTPGETLLRRTNHVALGELQCAPGHSKLGGGGLQKCSHVRFTRSTAKLIREGDRLQVSTPNEAELHNVGDTYYRWEGSNTPGAIDWIAVSPSLLQEIVSEIAIPGLWREGAEFLKPLAPVSGPVYPAQRYLFESLRCKPDVNDLAVDEYVVKLLHFVLNGPVPAAAGRRVQTRAAARR
jgi:hypothetical protein